MENENFESPDNKDDILTDNFKVSKTWLSNNNGESIDLLTVESNVKPVVTTRMSFLINLTKVITVLLFIIAISLALLGYEYVIYTFNGDNIYGILMILSLVNILNTRFFYFKNKDLSNKLLFFNILILFVIFGQGLTEID